MLRVLERCPAILQQHIDLFGAHFLKSSTRVAVARTKLVAWLNALGAVKRSKTTVPSEYVLTVYDKVLTLLSFPDVSIQTAALTCLLNFAGRYSSERILSVTDHEATRLRNLLNDKLWKEELVAYRDADAMDVDEDDKRTDFGLFLVRLLYGVLRDRRRVAAKGRAADTRKACLRFIANQCGTKELSLLFQLMMEPFYNNILSLLNSPSEALFVEQVKTDVNDHQQIGFLTLQEDVICLLSNGALHCDAAEWRDNRHMV